MKFFTTTTFLLALIMSTATAPQVEAQTVKFTTETRMKVGGVGGLAARMMGANKVNESTVFVTENAMRSDDGKDASSIVVLADEKIVSLDHKKKAYFEMTFDDMKAFMDDAKTRMQERMGEAEESGLDPNDLKFDISVDDLGETQEIAGYRTHRKLMRMDFSYSGEVAADDGSVHAVMGNMHAVSDMWVAEDVEGDEMLKAFGQAYAEKIGGVFGDGKNPMSGMMAMFGGGGTSEAMSKMGEEIQKIDGTALKTTMYIVLVPEGAELDVDALLNGAGEQEEGKKKRRGGLGRLAKGALSGRGINIGGNNDEEEAAPEEMGQQVVAETETIYTAIGRVDDDPSRFEVPGNYKQMENPMRGN